MELFADSSRFEESPGSTDHRVDNFSRCVKTEMQNKQDHVNKTEMILHSWRSLKSVKMQINKKKLLYFVLIYGRNLVKEFIQAQK